jgi:hypothetical protein
MANSKGFAVKSLTRFFLLASIALAGTFAQAHHSFQATFTSDAKTDVEGVVTKFSFKNPHVLIYLDVTNDDGSITNWMSEGAAATLMRRAGWDKNTVQPGDLIRVHGDSSRDGSPMVSIDSVDVLSADTRMVMRSLSRDAERRADQGATKAAPMPLKLADGRPNLTGAWTNHGMRGGRPTPPNMKFTEVGAALQSQFDKATDPQVFCDEPGLVRQLGTPHPIRITQLEDRVVIEYEEYAGRREILLGTETPAAGAKTRFGDSVARYEGDALIIETVNLLANPASPEGHPLSDQTTTVETYTRADTEEYGPTLLTRVTISDPVNLVEEGSISRAKMSAGNYEFIENDCQQPLRERNVVSPMMSFFLTSHGPGDGANLGGLDGADQYCASLAETVGAGGKKWRAYLSTSGVNARDRIGVGPWYNAKGILLATDIDQLHSDQNKLTKATVVDEHGQLVNGRGDDPNRHDILTGSQLDGTALSGEDDTTCSNWTSNGEGSALVGHFDRQGGGQNPTSWNSAHGSRGCSQADLQGTGGDGLLYCFAAD